MIGFFFHPLVSRSLGTTLLKPAWWVSRGAGEGREEKKGVSRVWKEIFFSSRVVTKAWASVSVFVSSFDRGLHYIYWGVHRHQWDLQSLQFPKWHFFPQNHSLMNLCPSRKDRLFSLLTSTSVPQAIWKNDTKIKSNSPRPHRLCTGFLLFWRTSPGEKKKPSCKLLTS